MCSKLLDHGLQKKREKKTWSFQVDHIFHLHVPSQTRSLEYSCITRESDKVKCRKELVTSKARVMLGEEEGAIRGTLAFISQCVKIVRSIDLHFMNQ